MTLLGSVQALVQLREDRIHYLSRKEDFTVRNWRRLPFYDGTVEGLDQILHAGLHVEVPCPKSTEIGNDISAILLGEY
jgi:hypothetical protein